MTTTKMKVKLLNQILNISIGYNPRRQTSTTQGYKSWFHDITNISIPGVNMLKNSSTLPVSVPINLFIKLGCVSLNGPWKLTLWTRYLIWWNMFFSHVSAFSQKNKTYKMGLGVCICVFVCVCLSVCVCVCVCVSVYNFGPP